MNKTKIEWTHRPDTIGMTWNPIHFKRDDGGSTKTGNMCTRISPGCKHCYASTLNQRWGNRLEFVAENLSKGHFYLDEKELQAPLRQKKPCTIFVGDMFDLFHEAIPEEFVGHVWGVMAQCQQHTLQVLTKRASEMLDLIGHAEARWGPFEDDCAPLHYPPTWPLKNVWCGVSVESQKYADERIPLLLQTPAAVRFLSVEPQLEAVDLFEWLKLGGISWVICGGESGPGARPFNLTWAESLREQCKAAGVSFFCKQLGSRPQVHSCRNESCTHPDCGMDDIRLKDRKGGDPSEWPESLRVREWPA